MAVSEYHFLSGLAHRVGALDEHAPLGRLDRPACLIAAILVEALVASEWRAEDAHIMAVLIDEEPMPVIRPDNIENACPKKPPVTACQVGDLASPGDDVIRLPVVLEPDGRIHALF